MKRYDVTAFGETMLRLSVPVGRRLSRAMQLDVYAGGAESNVLGALAQLGRGCGWFSALSANALGERVAHELRGLGIDLAGVSWQQEGRLGTYFIEHAAPPRSAQVIYDRAGSCLARLAPDEVAFDGLLDARLLHLTGITPALSSSCRDILAEAIDRARAAGTPFSFDVNYRARLWPEAEAGRVLASLIEGAALLFCSQGDARRLFGVTGEATAVAERLAQRFGAGCVVVSAAEAGAVMWEAGRIHEAPAYPVQTIDRLGAGDALAAGVIHGWLDGDLAAGLRYGAVLAALALTQFGDIVITSREELDDLLLAGGGGIVR